MEVLLNKAEVICKWSAIWITIVQAFKDSETILNLKHILQINKNSFPQLFKNDKKFCIKMMIQLKMDMVLRPIWWENVSKKAN